MNHVEFTPQLSDREANRAMDTKWKADDGTLHDGAWLAKRMWSFGIIEHVEQLLAIPVGGCLKTGVSAYERMA